MAFVKTVTLTGSGEFEVPDHVRRITGVIEGGQGANNGEMGETKPFDVKVNPGDRIPYEVGKGGKGVLSGVDGYIVINLHYD